MKNNKGPKILCVDLETSPLLAWVWGMYDQNISLDMIKEDWHIISFAAKWVGQKNVIQHDLRKGINVKNEKAMLLKLWKLLDECDIVMGQNSKKFDVKKINEKFLQHGIKPPSPFRHFDTFVISKKHFAPTSHKLEYRSKNLNKKFKKLSHSKYPGFSLWRSCMEGDKKAWNELATYNIFDVLATEEYAEILRPWTNDINFNVYHDELVNKCSCGSTHLQKRGFNFSNSGKYQRYLCTNCGSWTSGKTNLLSKEKRKSLRNL